jgi:hypothetical protein
VAAWGPRGAGGGHRSHEVVGVGEAERVGHLVLVLQQQLVVLAPRHAVELDADGGQERGGPLEGGQIGVVGQLGRVLGDGAQHAHVAQPAVALLEVGLEEEGDVARGSPALAHLRFEERQVLGPELVAPRRAGPFEQRVRNAGLAPDQTRVEEAEGDAHVVGRGRQHLGGPPHRVVQVDTLVPHRVPDTVGHRLDVAMAIVDEHHIEVAVGTQRPPPVAAHGHQGQVPPGVPGGAVGQVGEPFVGLGGVAATEFLAHQALFGEQPATPLAE